MLLSTLNWSCFKYGYAECRLYCTCCSTRVDSIYIPKIEKTAILNKPTVGQRLVVNKKLKLVSKKKHDAGVFGYETRQAFKEKAKEYEDIMTKGKKKK